MRGPTCVVWADLTPFSLQATFIYRDGVSAMLDSYISGECDSIALGKPDIRSSRQNLEFFCDHQLVSSGVVVIEQPIAFPARTDLVAGLSHRTLNSF